MGSDLTDDEQQALLRAGPRVCKVWGLSDDDTARLFSDGQEDRAQRVGALVGIHVALMIIFAGDAVRVREWLSAPNQAPYSTGGMSAIQAMSQGGLPAMMQIRRYLEAEVAG